MIKVEKVFDIPSGFMGAKEKKGKLNTNIG